MHTQSHAIFTFFFLTRRALGRRVEGLKHVNMLIFSGAVLPDLPIFVFFFWYTLITPTTQRVMWSELAFRDDWQALFSAFHSFPIWGTAAACFLVLKKFRATLFCIAGLLSSIQDFIVHHDDGHAHFFPFSDYRFTSPVSYWDPAHYGSYVSIAEGILVIAASMWAYYRLESRWGKGLLIATVLSLFATHAFWIFLFSIFQ